MYDLFHEVSDSLFFISKLTGLSYKAINIILYFICIPFVYFALLDKLLKFHYLKISFLVFTIIFLLFLPSFENFSVFMFLKSQEFLFFFRVIGLDYIEASIVFCVLIPLLIFIVLLGLIVRKILK